MQIKKYSLKKFKEFSKEKKEKTIVISLNYLANNWSNVKIKKIFIPYCKSICSEVLNNKNIFKIYRQFYYFMINIENKFAYYKKDSDFLANSLEKKEKSKILPVIIILDNLRSAFNVGSIVRSCECFAVQEIAFCGCSPNLTNPKVQKTSMETYKLVRAKYFKKTLDAIKYYKNLNYKILAIETSPNPIALNKYEFSPKSALVFGNEALGIEDKVLENCEEVINIPMQGWKKSLNVGVCLGLVLYQINLKLNAEC